MACASLQAAEPELAHTIATGALSGAGTPLPRLMDLMEDAGWWADLATPEERRAYAVACFNRFSQRERDEFRAFVEGR